MPNHFHAIVIIEDCNRNKSRDVLQNVSTINKNMSVISPASNSLGTIIRAFKAAVTRKCKQIKINGFGWQERFYDHIIRNENSLNKIRGYIKNNVIKWELDEYHPDKLRIREDL